MMSPGVNKILEELFTRYPELSGCREPVEKAYEMLRTCFLRGGKVMVCGNGGSAADSEHIVGELMKGFLKKRPICSKDRESLKAAFPEDCDYLADNLQGALPAISLVSQSAVSTAFINDVAADMVYAQQVYGYAREGDVLLGISTSGNAKNVANAMKVAKAMGAGTIGLTGSKGGYLLRLCDAVIRVPSDVTFRIQEYHLPIYHALCAMLEEELF